MTVNPDVESYCILKSQITGKHSEKLAKKAKNNNLLKSKNIYTS